MITTLEQAKQFLSQYDLHILKDSAFGDSELTWICKSDIEHVHEVAYGYLNQKTSASKVTIIDGAEKIHFYENHAQELAGCFKTIHIESNN